MLLVFLKMFPGLVESGKVYKAVPPLYGIPMGSKTKYFSERVDYVRYMQKEYYKKNTVTDLKGHKIDASVFSRILIENSDYVYDFTAIKDRYKLDSRLLEIILMSHIKGEKFETLRKRITSEYRFMTNDNITKVNKSTIRIKGLVNGRIETVFLNDRFIEECKPVLSPIEKALKENHMEFLVNGKKIGLYDLLKDAMNSLGTVSRYKGLGEMDFDQLRETTMSKDTRTLIQYTVDDIDETIRIIRQYDSNKKLILNHIGVVDRGDLIGI